MSGAPGADWQHRRRVRVWFGQHVIAQYVADEPLAGRYEEAMRRRFSGLRVTNDVVGPRRDLTRPATVTGE